MRRYAKDNKGLRVYSAETGEEIPRVRWFDDETWEYEQTVHLVGEDGTIFYFTDAERPGELLGVIKQGGIEVRKAPAQDDQFKVTPAEIVEGST